MSDPKYINPEQAIELVQSGNRIFLHGSACTPLVLLNGLLEHGRHLKGVELMSISALGDIDLTEALHRGQITINSLFVSKMTRYAVQNGYGDYIPVFLSEISRLFEKGILPLDLAFIQVSPPDKHGYCSLGVSVDVAKSAVKHAKITVAQVNPNMPRTHGDGMIHISQINYLVEESQDLPEVDYRTSITAEDTLIGTFCAALIDDRSTLQLGIGAIPDAVLQCLHNHKDLGIHTEMFSNGVIDLFEKGVITNRFKAKHKGKVVSSFAIGNKRLYDFVDDNPAFGFLEAAYVNDTKVIRVNPNVVAINSAIEVDLTGQVCADSIGSIQYSGVGGQMDFIRGAALSENGKPIIALRSTTGSGKSKIVPFLKEGAGVVSTRAHIHYVVTEYGIAYLYGKNLRQRAQALIEIAHPDHRESLSEAAGRRFDVR